MSPSPTWAGGESGHPSQRLGVVRYERRHSDRHHEGANRRAATCVPSSQVLTAQPARAAEFLDLSVLPDDTLSPDMGVLLSLAALRCSMSLSGYSVKPAA
jgi:hypothetical protein